MHILVDDHIRLELTDARHAQPLLDAVNKNRAHLSKFLPWVDYMQSVEDFKAYIRNCDILFQQQREVSFVIYYGKELAGRIGLHHMNMQNKAAAIGYWVCKNMQGKGIITQSCKTLINYGFNNLQLHRIEIKAATHNLKSQAIPEKLHFKKEGVLRAAELVNNVYFDLFVYSILRPEWPYKEQVTPLHT